MKPAIVGHGGASCTSDQQGAVDSAIEKAWAGLLHHDSAIDAAIQAVSLMEDDIRLNAGTGSNPRIGGKIQLDAAIATNDGRFGSVIGIEETPNPIFVAASLLSNSVNTLYGSDARDFADIRGIAKHPVVGRRNHSSDTVGAIARDTQGVIAVASSTGGPPDRIPGRVGDTAIFGSGVWCDSTVGIAATGIGEAIMRDVSCFRVAQCYLGSAGAISLSDCIIEYLDKVGETFEIGFIALTSNGMGLGIANTAMPWRFCTCD